MPRNFDWLTAGAGTRGPRFWLQVGCIALGVANAIALFLYLAPPGGSKEDLINQSVGIRNQIVATRAKAQRLKDVAEKVQLGNTESSAFQAMYFLPKRRAYETLIGELQRLVQESGVQARDAVYTEEPIEGTADLTLLNSTARYEGTYVNLMKFLNQVDRSPMLLMLYNLQAAPQQRGGLIDAEIRFQTVVQEEPVVETGGRP
jgi:hypothetical protein